MRYNRRPERLRKAFKGVFPRALGNPQGKPCHWCARPMRAAGDKSNLGATRDHVMPKSKGGKKTVWACRACNNLKGNRTPEQWRKWCDENPKWWKLAAPVYSQTAVGS